MIYLRRMLCEVCENIDFDELHRGTTPKGTGYLHHRNYAELASCLECDFCRAIVREAALKPKAEWRFRQIYLRVFPSSLSPDRDEKSNLTAYCLPRVPGQEAQIGLATFGLLLERTEYEKSTGKP